MNRELKFRVWDKKSKHMLYPRTELYVTDYCDSGYPAVAQELGNEGNYFTASASRGNFIIQQFTGSVDQDNKEIFEGDIIKFKRVWEHPNKTSTTSPDDEVYTYDATYFVKWERGTFWLANEKGIKEVIHYNIKGNHPTTVMRE